MIRPLTAWHLAVTFLILLAGSATISHLTLGPCQASDARAPAVHTIQHQGCVVTVTIKRAGR